MPPQGSLKCRQCNSNVGKCRYCNGHGKAAFGPCIHCRGTGQLCLREKRHKA
jgi:hypothetical protein